jgi:hypothetical protein
MPDSEAMPGPLGIPWLADSPMFIDAQQVSSFYNAVIGPEFRTVQLQISEDRSEQLQKSFGAKLGARLPGLFPWLKLDGELEAGRAKTTGQADGQSITLQPVEDPARQLVKLSLHYKANHPERIWFQEGPDWNLPLPDKILQSPRMIAFIDAPPGTQFLPAAAELNDGRVVAFFDPLIEKLKRDGGTLPVAYPEDAATGRGRPQRDDYWDWFTTHWNANKVVQVIEEHIGAGGRPRWIDYRIPFPAGQTLHLHVAGHGEFDTGVFAYNMVKRGWRHGLRIVGSVKSKPSLNVLAIYEK